MATQTTRAFVLSRRPTGLVDDQTLTLVERTLPEPSEGEVLVQNLYLSMDPTYRIWMNEGDSYVPAIPLGEVMRGITVGRVMASRAAGLQEGDLVTGVTGWTERAVVGAKSVNRLPPGIDPQAALGVLGHNGLTAYFGLLELGKPQPGQTVLVSGAAGATGSLVGQIAKIKGCRVVGTTGSEAKRSWLVEEAGFDAVVNYRKTPDLSGLSAAVAEACPKGVDVFFDNVGGLILDAALANLALRGRVVLCGAISVYNQTKPEPGPRNYLQLVMQRGRMEGFIVMDYLPRAAEAINDLAQWFAAGQLTYRTDVVDGLENAPSALNRLFEGAHHGKLLVRLSADRV